MAAYLALRSSSRKRRIRVNPLQMPEVKLIYEYRLSRAAILEICELLREDLQPTIKTAKALSVEDQVLISLKLLASGSFQTSRKDNINVAQPTVSVVLSRFLDSLLRKKKRIYVYAGQLNIPANKGAILFSGSFSGGYRCDRWHSHTYYCSS